MVTKHSIDLDSVRPTALIAPAGGIKHQGGSTSAHPTRKPNTGGGKNNFCSGGASDQPKVNKEADHNPSGGCPGCGRDDHNRDNCPHKAHPNFNKQGDSWADSGYGKEYLCDLPL
jgi:hypothetical protein